LGQIFGHAELLDAVSLLEAFYHTAAVETSFLTAVEGMTLRTDFDMYLFHCRADGKFLAASAFNFGIIKFGMYSFSHSSAPYIG
jgi:hypothetical protein